MRDSRPPSTRVEPTLHRHSLTCTALRDPQLKAMSQLPIKWTGPFGIGKTVRNVICNVQDQYAGKYRDCHPCMVTNLPIATPKQKAIKAAAKERCKDKWTEELEYTDAQVGRINTAEQTVNSFVDKYVPGFVRRAGTAVDDWATDKFQNMLRLRVAIGADDMTSGHGVATHVVRAATRLV